MLLRIAAFAALAALPGLLAATPPSIVPAETSAPALLSLDDAFVRVARHHPGLRLFDAHARVLDAEREQAALRPPRMLGVEIEGLSLDDGDRLGTLETTVGLASVFERGGKPDARRALAQSRIDALAMERERSRIDLLADTAHRHLAVTAATGEQAIARRDVAQRERMLAAARQRFRSGASPEAVVLSAQAALARAELRAARADRQFDSARRSLAVLWGESDPAFLVAADDPPGLPEIEDFRTLAERLQRSPELLRFNDRQRIAEARLRLARTEAVADVEWQAGLRHARDGGDVSLLGGFSIPLGQRQRARPGMRAAEAELEQLSLQRESDHLALLSTLADAHGRYRIARDEAHRLATDVLPRIARAEAATAHAWRAGASSHIEWAQLQDEHIDTLRQQLAAAIEAQSALIELQRLTGEPLLAASATDGVRP